MKISLPILKDPSGAPQSRAAPGPNTQKVLSASRNSTGWARRHQTPSKSAGVSDALRNESNLYAEIGPNLVNLARNRTMPGRSLWAMTNPTDNPPIRGESSGRQRQFSNNVSSSEGAGASAGTSRAISKDAMHRFDVPIPEAYARRHHNLAGTEAHLSVHVSETETVADAQTALSLAIDSSRRDGIAESFEQYFSLNAHNLHRSVLKDSFAEDYDAVEIRAFIKHFYLDLYKESETFAGLYNWALDNGRLGLDRKWSIHIQDPNMIADFRTSFDQAFHVNPATRNVYVPSLRSPIQLDEGYISSAGNLVPYTPQHVLIHEMVHVLTGMNDPDLSAWKDQSWCADTQLIGEFGLGERGAVEFLTQRIMKEASVNVPQRLSYLSLSEGDRMLLNLADVADYDALEQYVKLQDDYLDALIEQLRGYSSSSVSSTAPELVRQPFQNDQDSTGSPASRKRLNNEHLEPDLGSGPINSV